MLRGSVQILGVLKVIHVGEGIYLAKIIKNMLQSREKNICVQRKFLEKLLFDCPALISRHPEFLKLKKIFYDLSTFCLEGLQSV